MSTQPVDPAIRIHVDVTNPGQFFACCGLLELASRVDSNAEAAFCDNEFVVYGRVENTLSDLFSCTVDAEIVADDATEETEDDDSVDPHRGRIYPMTLRDPFNLRLDWWTFQEAQDQKIKTWTAGQRVTDILLGHHKRRKKKGQSVLDPIPSMRDHFRDAVVEHPSDWLRQTRPVAAPMAFSYDSRLSRNNALDLGHVTDAVMEFSPAIDVLTIIGLQRFRPRTIETWTRNQFCTWKTPVPVQIAPAAALGIIPSLIDGTFEFPVKPRDSQGRFKLFGHAHPVRRHNA